MAAYTWTETVYPWPSGAGAPDYSRKLGDRVITARVIETTERLVFVPQGGRENRHEMLLEVIACEGVSPIPPKSRIIRATQEILQH